MILKSRESEMFRWANFVRIKNEVYINEPGLMSQGLVDLMIREGVRKEYNNVTETTINRDKGFIIMRGSNVYLCKEVSDGETARKETMRIVDDRFFANRVTLEEISAFRSQLNTIPKDMVIRIGKKKRWNDIKAFVRNGQKHHCADCGEIVGDLQIHHRVPANHLLPDYRGLPEPYNSIGLCGERSEHFCHKKWNGLAFNGIVFPGIEFKKVPSYLYVDYTKRRRVR